MFSFGVFLLVLLTGRPAGADSAREMVPLYVWANHTFPIEPALRAVSADNVVDPRILPRMGKHERKLAVKLAHIARRCIGELDSRPDMGDVSNTIRSLVDSYNAAIAK